MFQKTPLLVLVLLILLGPLQSFAESPATACKSDIRKYCRKVEGTDGQVLQCLRKHKSGLSRDCREELKDAKLDRIKRKDECKGDRKRFCKKVEPGNGKVLGCLKAHEKKLSDDCREQILNQ